MTSYTPVKVASRVEEVDLLNNVDMTTEMVDLYFARIGLAKPSNPLSQQVYQICTC